MKHLRVADLDIEDSGLRLHAKWTKSRKAGFQRIPAGVTRALAELAEGKPADAPLLRMPRHISDWLNADLEKAGDGERGGDRTRVKRDPNKYR